MEEDEMKGDGERDERNEEEGEHREGEEKKSM